MSMCDIRLRNDVNIGRGGGLTTYDDVNVDAMPLGRRKKNIYTCVFSCAAPAIRDCNGILSSDHMNMWNDAGYIIDAL